MIHHKIEVRWRMTRDLTDEQDAALTIEMVKNARMRCVYIIDRPFQHRLAAMRYPEEVEVS